MRLSQEQLAVRGARIQQLLRPISKNISGPAWSRVARGTDAVIIGTHDEARPTSHYRDWRFTVDAKDYHAMYFELWRLKTQTRFSLEQAYLSVYQRIISDEREVICLHCDPLTASNAEHGKYKRGPHIHMSMAGSPFDKAHIALSGPNIEPVLRSMATLHSAFAWGVQMIRDEILTLLDAP
jgi:hypothetical protein